MRIAAFRYGRAVELHSTVEITISYPAPEFPTMRANTFEKLTKIPAKSWITLLEASDTEDSMIELMIGS